MVFSYASPTELVLEITPSTQARAEHQSQALAPSQRWIAYLNALCLNTVLPWLQAEYAPSPQVWLAEELPALWGLVTGTAIAIGNKRFVLLPTQPFDIQLTVPQEWVDSPTWAADYFLAIQVDAIEGWLRIWGYATQAQLKQQAEYEAGDRTYCLDATQVIADITALAVICQLNPQEQTQVAIAPLPALPTTQIPTLLQTLRQIQTVESRLVLPFHQWAELLSQPALRQQLYPLRQPAATSNPVVNLANWLQQQFEEGWQSIDLFQAQPQLAYNLRSQATTTEIRRARSIALQTNHHVTLVVSLEPASSESLESTDSPRVAIRLYPGERPFPEALTLTLLTTTGELVQSVQATEQAEFIQLKRFRCRPGTMFQVQVALDYPIFTEQFVG